MSKLEAHQEVVTVAVGWNSRVAHHLCCITKIATYRLNKPRGNSLNFFYCSVPDSINWYKKVKWYTPEISHYCPCIVRQMNEVVCPIVINAPYPNRSWDPGAIRSLRPFFPNNSLGRGRYAGAVDDYLCYGSDGICMLGGEGLFMLGRWEIVYAGAVRDYLYRENVVFFTRQVLLAQNFTRKML